MNAPLTGMPYQRINVTMQPLVEVIQSDLTAYEAFGCFQSQASVAFLESRPGYGQAGRYSILAINPYQSLQYWPNHCLLDGKKIQEDVFLVLDRLLAADRTESIPGLPLVGGCIGFIAYDAGFDLVGLPLPERVIQAAGRSRPLVSFDFYDNFLIYDHETGQIRALACGRLEPAENSLAKLRDCLKRAGADAIDDGTAAETGPVPGREGSGIARPGQLSSQD
jgi:anthranilate/para-aminobenzoate synthase component I